MKYQQLVAMPASVQDWLDHELEMRGIDAVVYTRYILSLLQQENFDSESADGDLFPMSAKQNLREVPVGRSKGKSKLRADRIKSLNFEEMRKSAAVECLMSVSDQKCGIEKLVDELCDKLKSIQGNDNVRCDQQDIYDTATLLDTNSLASSSPEEQAEKYYEAFPALSGAIEPLEMSETIESVSTVWDNKKVAPKQEADENISNAENAPNGSTPTEENKKVEKDLIKSEDCPKTKICAEIEYHDFGLLGAVEDLIKPSFIVPKYKTNTNRQKLSLVKGKTPFNVPPQKTYHEASGMRCPKKRSNAAGKIIIDQHSEENTEESSLDNSFDDDFPIKSSLTSTIDSLEDDVSDGKTDPFSENNDTRDEAEIAALNGNFAETSELANKEDEILAKLTAKFNESVAAIWSDELSKDSHVANSENIWQSSSNADVEKDDNSALMGPQHLRSLFTCRSDPTVNVVWVHSKILKDPTEIIMPEEAAFLENGEKISPDESIDEAAEEFFTLHAAEKLPIRGLFKSTLWEWHDNETFIQGGVYGSVLPGNKWKINTTDSLPEGYVHQNSPITDSDDSLLESEVDSDKNVSGEDEMQYVWDILGRIGHALQKNTLQDEAGQAAVAERARTSESSADESSFADEPEMVDTWQGDAGEKPFQIAQLEDKLVDLKSIWNSMHYEVEPIKIKVPTPHFQPRENEVANSILWPMQQSPQHGPLLTRSYDSYLNKMLTGEPKDGDNEDGAFRSEPTLLPTKNCTLTYHKGESRFVEVIPSAKTEWLQVPSQNVQTLNILKHAENSNNDDDEDQENLLTSPKTHFRPIRQDSCESDTTGSSDNGEEQAINDDANSKVESASVNECRELTSNYDLDSLYLNYKDDGGDSSDELCNLARDLDESKEKFSQTEVCSGERVTTERETEYDGDGDQRDDCTDILNAVIDVLDGMLDRKMPGNIKFLTDNSNASSKSVSPLSFNDDELEGSINEFRKYPSILSSTEASLYNFEDTLYYDARNVWKSLDDVYADSGLDKWSTAQEERSLWFEEYAGVPWSTCKDPDLRLSEDGPEIMDELPTPDTKQNSTDVTNMKSLREEIKDEEEQLFEDIDHQRILHLENTWGSSSVVSSESRVKPDWLPKALATLNMNSAEDEICPELEMIHCRQRIYSSSDGDDGTYAEMRYAEHSWKSKDVEAFEKKLPVIPTSKALYSEDLEEEWRSNGKLFDLPVQIPKIKYKKIAPQKRPCSFYLEGNCRRSDCKFSHDLASITCRFWEEGSCFKGITCPFLHGYHSEQNKENSGHKSEFKLELESETHFPSLSSKPRLHARKQELCHSSSSDSTPMAPNKRRRKRSTLKQRVLSPQAQAELLAKSAKSHVLSKEPRSGRGVNGGSSSEDDNVDI